MGSNILESLTRAYFKSKAMKEYGPNWVEEQERARLGNRTAEAQLANMPTPEEARAGRSATIESTRALAGYRGAQAEGVMGRLEDADLDRNLKAAIAEYQRDPSNPLNQQRLAAAKAATARAGWDAARTANPGAYRSTGTTLLPYAANVGGQPTLIDRRTGQPIPGMAPMETAEQRNRQAGMGRAGVVFNAIAELSKEINTSEGGIGARVGGIARRGAGAAGYDPVMQQYRSLVRGFTPLFARAVGHTGVLTEQDVQRTEELFPLPTDSAQEADLKLAQVEAILSGQAQLPFRFGEGVAPAVSPRAPAPSPAAPPAAPAAAPLGADPLEGRTATGPNGQKLIRRNGQWVPL